MIRVAVRIWRLLTLRERRRLLLVMAGMIAAAAAEVAGIVSVFPFLALAGDPGAIERNQFLGELYSRLGFQSPNRFLVFVGILVLVVLVARSGVAIVSRWAMLRFTWMRSYSFSKRLLVGYLHQPYEFYFGRNTTTLGRNILSESQTVVSGLLLPSMQLVSSCLTVIFVLCLLLVVSPSISLIVGGGLGSCYMLFYWVVRQKLRAIGKDRVSANKARFKVATEAFTNLKLVKVMRLEPYFTSQFVESAFRYADRVARSAIISAFPRYVIETLAFSGILVMVLVLLSSSRDLGLILPLLGVYALSGYRLLPALQSVFSAAARMRFAVASLEALEEDLAEGIKHTKASVDCGGMQLNRALEAHDLSYEYPGSSDSAIRDLSFSVKAGSSVAFVGSTGSGKTTVADLVLGILSPTEGHFLIDGERLTPERVPAWQSLLGYVPQEICLVDDTVASNIAFGVPKEDVDVDAVERAARIACIHDFIAQELPEGYDTVVGERGLRLSGGERQRIGIARALYRDPPVLVFDEATSALDGVTEANLLKGLRDSSAAKTLLVIAHRFTSIKDCETIYVLERGSVRAKGSYQELLKTCPLFRELGRASA